MTEYLPGQGLSAVEQSALRKQKKGATTTGASSNSAPVTRVVYGGQYGGDNEVAQEAIAAAAAAQAAVDALAVEAGAAVAAAQATADAVTSEVTAARNGSPTLLAQLQALWAGLTGKANSTHAHAASDVSSGTLELARIPATLTGKDADTLDGQHLADIVAGSATLKGWRTQFAYANYSTLAAFNAATVYEMGLTLSQGGELRHTNVVDHSHSFLWSMVVQSATGATIVLPIFENDDSLFIYINGTLVGSWQTTETYRAVTLTLPAGNSVLQILLNNGGGNQTDVQIAQWMVPPVTWVRADIS
ncbi:MAG TPA: hypothetical protein VGL77_11110 [Armatimonadota bacterium]|jgi:hypothetical protein